MPAIGCVIPFGLLIFGAILGAYFGGVHGGYWGAGIGAGTGTLILLAVIFFFLRDRDAG